MADDVEVDVPVEEETIDAKLTWEGVRYAIERMAEQRGEWAGIPVPATGLVVEDRYPWKDIELVSREIGDREFGRDVSRTCSTEDMEWEIRNRWHAYGTIDADIILAGKKGRTTHAVKVPRGPAQRMEVTLGTFEAIVAWDLDTEYRAWEKLLSLVGEYKFKCYMMLGQFLEKSPRSGVTYMFRKLRPTIAMAVDSESGRMKILAALCMHPIAYYQNTWAGAMCPTDDVIAHLCMMRGDEHKYWARSNQHPSWAPESGI
jgi:hypothetical protein